MVIGIGWSGPLVHLKTANRHLAANSDDGDMARPARPENRSLASHHTIVPEP
jgi:hypothetical protein